jgi:hypothetical protein
VLGSAAVGAAGAELVPPLVARLHRGVPVPATAVTATPVLRS